MTQQSLPTALPSQLNTQTSTVTPPGPSGQPPSHYVCHKCGVPGHYVQDCPLPPGRQSQGGQRSNRGQPPGNYICHKCNKPGTCFIFYFLFLKFLFRDYVSCIIFFFCFVLGHWIQDCPSRTGPGPMGGGLQSNPLNPNQLQQNRYGQPKQQDYSKPPPANYICHRCHVPGHWIKNCPTNGDPTFDKNPPPLPQSTTTISAAAVCFCINYAFTLFLSLFFFFFFICCFLFCHPCTFALFLYFFFLFFFFAFYFSIRIWHPTPPAMQTQQPNHLQQRKEKD